MEAPLYRVAFRLLSSVSKLCYTRGSCRITGAFFLFFLMMAASTSSPPLFPQEKLEEVERLLREIEAEQEGPTLTDGERPRRRASESFPKWHESEEERKRAARQEREELWRQHIGNVRRYLDEQKKPIVESIQRKRAFRASKTVSQQPASSQATNRRDSSDAGQFPEPRRELFADYLLHGDDLEDFMDEKLSGSLPFRLHGL